MLSGSNRFRSPILLLFVIISLFSGHMGRAHAQNGEQVQTLRGRIEQPGDETTYRLPDLRQGQTLYVYAEGMSGNLDPFLALADTNLAPGSLTTELKASIEQAVLDGSNPQATSSELADQPVLVWDDDSGDGFAATLSYGILADGDYFLSLTDAPSNPSFGEYRLLIGIDAPAVLTGNAGSTGEMIALLEQKFDTTDKAVQVLTDTLSKDESKTFVRLGDFDAGDTLQVFVEPTSGDLAPKIVLRAFGIKPLQVGTYVGDSRQTVLEYTFPAVESSYRLDISASPGTSGDYRLLVGRNAPEVLSGEATAQGSGVVLPPTEARIGIKLQQITSIDQKGGQYGTVAVLGIQWVDPELAFSPDDCQCETKVFRGDDFGDFAAANELIWPTFTLFNQQGNRWSQNKRVVVQPNGQATYFERFSTTFQAPDFDFRRFPFDRQSFFIAVQSLQPAESLTYVSSDSFSEVGAQLGEEEWYVTDFGTDVSTETAVTVGEAGRDEEAARFTFQFFAQRRLVFYAIRIFVPLLLIIIVAWITFFMQDYIKRVEITSANLLLFIAFNFTIADDLPRLGYLTYVDVLLVCTFVISVVVVAYNVYLKRLENKGNRAKAERIDKIGDWLYPLFYVGAFGITTVVFFF